MAEDWVSIAEAARRLSAAGDQVGRSALSRYLKQHAEALPLRVENKTPLVEFSALSAHRGENIRLMQGRAPMPDAAPATIRAPAYAEPAGRRFVGTQTDGAARKAMADAELRELQLAEKRKQVTPVAEVDRAGRDAVALMQSAFDQAIEADTAQFALRYGWDERHVRLTLKQFARRGLDVFHREMLDRLEALRQAEQEEPGVAAPG